MKKAFITLGLMFCAVLVQSCGQGTEQSPTEVSNTTPSAADIHTEFLQLVFDRIDESARKNGAAGINASDKANLMYEVAHEIATKYGATPLSGEEVGRHIDRGRQMAQEDPMALVEAVLPPAEFQWWKNFASRSTVENARADYKVVVRRYGKPAAGSMLAEVVEISLSSAEFWTVRHRNDRPIAERDDLLPGKPWWKRTLRFAVLVATDGLAGGATMLSGPVVAGIVGGLSSIGADCMLFGC